MIRRQHFYIVRNILGEHTLRLNQCTDTIHRDAYRVLKRGRKPEVFVDIRSQKTFDNITELMTDRTGIGKNKLAIVKVSKNSEKTDSALEILDGNSKAVCKAVNKIDDVELLSALLTREKEWKNRKTVVAEIEQQIQQVSE